MSKTWLALVGAVLVLLSLAWLLRSEQARAVSEPGASGAGTDAPVPSAAAGGSASMQPSPMERERVGAEAGADAAAPANAVLRGRFVDAEGRAVPGVTVDFLGSNKRGEEAEAWRKLHHALPENVRVKSETSADGRFEFAFTPWSIQGFSLHFRKPGFALGHGNWNNVAAAAVIDLGDIVLAPGGALHGRLIEADGAPAARAQIAFQQPDDRRRQAALGTLTSGGGQTDADGRFAFDGLELGDYVLNVYEREIRSGDKVSLTMAAPTATVDVVLVAEDPKAMITGIVVDERDAPVANARVESMGGGAGVSTRRDGAFVLRARDASDHSRLFCEASGYDEYRTAEPVPWGARDVRLVLRASPGLEVTVVDTAGKPVVDYSVRVYRKPGTTGRYSSRDFEVRARGDRDGIARVAAVPRGEHLVVVDPPDAALGSPLFTPVTMADPGPVRVFVKLPAQGQRHVHVQFADGTPAAGCRLQLVEGVEGPVTSESTAVAFARWSALSGGTPGWKALVVDDTKADERGEAIVHGRADQPLTLLLPGPGHLPTLVQGVALAGETLGVTVNRGAILTGKVTPAAVMSELRRVAEVPAIGEWPSNWVPWIQLSRMEAGNRWVRFPSNGNVPARIDADGNFRLDGVPAGTWDLSLCHFVMRSGGGSSRDEKLPPVTLRDGETTTVDVDLSTLLPGTLRGRVLRFGAPLPNTVVNLVTKVGDQEAWEGVKTDGDGNFRIELRRGTWSLRLWTNDSKHFTNLVAAGTANVTVGQVCEATFALAGGELRLRLLDGDGKPVLATPMLYPASGTATALEPIDADGWHAATLDADTFTVRVLPQRLLSQQARQAFLAAHADDPDAFAKAELTLGTFTLNAGDTLERELRLPPEWSR